MKDKLKNNSALSTQHSALFLPWGRGIEKITDACKAAGLPEPIIEENSGGIAIELLKAEVRASGKRRESVGNEGSEKGSEKSSEKGSEKIIGLLLQPPRLTIAELAVELEISTRAVEKHLKNLQVDGLLRRVGGRKEGYWEVIESDEG
jgi:ATP-dependent DNA helicase RecG